MLFSHRFSPADQQPHNVPYVLVYNNPPFTTMRRVDLGSLRASSQQQQPPVVVAPPGVLSEEGLVVNNNNNINRRRSSTRRRARRLANNINNNVQLAPAAFQPNESLSVNSTNSMQADPRRSPLRTEQPPLLAFANVRPKRRKRHRPSINQQQRCNDDTVQRRTTRRSTVYYQHEALPAARGLQRTSFLHRRVAQMATRQTANSSAMRHDAEAIMNHRVNNFK
jgi:hypothetical protein